MITLDSWRGSHRKCIKETRLQQHIPGDASQARETETNSVLVCLSKLSYSQRKLNYICINLQSAPLQDFWCILDELSYYSNSRYDYCVCVCVL